MINYINYIGRIHCHITVHPLIWLFSSHKCLISLFLLKFYISWHKTNVAIPTFPLFLPSVAFIKPLVIYRSVRCSKPTSHFTTIPITSSVLSATSSVSEKPQWMKTLSVAGSCTETPKSKEERFFSHSPLQICVHVASDNTLAFSADKVYAVVVSKSVYSYLNTNWLQLFFF